MASEYLGCDGQMDESLRHLQTLYEAHGSSLLIFLRRRASAVELAEDLLQETFLQALRRVDRLDEAASPRAWLFAIARNLCATAHRRRRTVAELSEEPAVRKEIEEDPRLPQMRQAIADLPAKYREVLELRLQHEMSYEEIAEVIAIPVGTVRSRLHYAVRSLREQLNQPDTPS